MLNNTSQKTASSEYTEQVPSRPRGSLSSKDDSAQHRVDLVAGGNGHIVLEESMESTDPTDRETTSSSVQFSDANQEPELAVTQNSNPLLQPVQSSDANQQSEPAELQNPLAVPAKPEISRKSEFDNWFEDSTHHLLLTTGNDVDALFYRGGAGTILSFQIIAYLVMLWQAAGDYSDPSFVLKTSKAGCDEIDKFVNGTRAFSFDHDDVTCEVDELHHDVQSVVILCVIAALLLMSDLARDVVGSFHVMCPNHLKRKSAARVNTRFDSRSDFWTFFYAFMICVESVLACSSAIMFSFVSMQEGNSADAIMNCVAVLFLHDIDEKLFPLFEKFRTDEDLNGKVLFALFAFLFVLVLVLGLSLEAVSIRFDLFTH